VLLPIYYDKNTVFFSIVLAMKYRDFEDKKINSTIKRYIAIKI